VGKRCKLQGRPSISTNGATEPWPISLGICFQLKIFFLKNG